MNPLVRRYLLLGIAILLLALSLALLQVSQLRASSGTVGQLTNARELTSHLLALGAATDRAAAPDFAAAAAASRAAEASLKTMSFTVLSKLPVAMSVPSGLKATE